MPKTIDHSPSPKSHIKTLRKIGYTLNSAVADIIDNSLASDARSIQILCPPGKEHPTVSILDDGYGMTPEELIGNMRIGCKDPDEERSAGDLGRFGSGMKTASFSQARQLTVVSKKRGHRLAAARWDLDKVESTNSWCLEVFDEKELGLIPELSPRLKIEGGTQIIWNNLTFLDSSSHAEDHDKELAYHLSELAGYIALHFHRFMSGKDKRIFKVNNSVIEPLDPFLIGEPGYQEGPAEKIRCKGGRIVIQTHVLPHLKRIDSMKLSKMGGAGKINQQQGLYIYREKRLISAGGWMGMAVNSQLGGLARVQVDIPSGLDNEWSTDVKKASLQIPPKVKRSLKKFLADPVNRSKRVHRYRGKLDTANRFWKIREDENKKTISYSIDPDNESLKELIVNLDSVSKSKLLEYLKELSINIPINHIYENMSERPQDINQEDVDMTALENIIGKVFEGKK